MYLAGETLKHIAKLFNLMTQIRTDVTEVCNSTNRPQDPFPLPQLDANVTKVRQEIVALEQLYAQLEPYPVLEQTLLAVDNLQKAIDDIRELYRVSLSQMIWHVLRWESSKSKAYNALQRRTDTLQREIQIALDKLAEYMSHLMPVSLSEQAANHLHYEQVRQSPQAAIQLAFALLEEYVRDKIGVGPEVFGEELVNMAFGKEGRLTYGEVPAEQIGARNLISGVYATLRNPRMHRILKDDEHTAITVISLVDLLMKIVDEAKPK